ncbi:Uncharacterised protein [uncultured archaeon]|nr:Uncharacterised protein [uncultured archaeon]
MHENNLGRPVILLLSHKAILTKEIHVLLTKAGYQVYFASSLKSIPVNVKLINLVLVACDDCNEETTYQHLKEFRSLFPTQYLVILSNQPISLPNQLRLVNEFKVNVALSQPVDPDTLLESIQPYLN